MPDSMEVKRPASEEDRPTSDRQAAKPASSIPRAGDNIPAYVVLLITRYGLPRRKVYLDLGHARKAVARTKAQGRQAWLVLCELRPVGTDLDLDGEVAS